MKNEKNELSLHTLPPQLIFLIVSFLDKNSFLRFRVSKSLEQITFPLFFKIAKDKIASDKTKIACGNSSVLFARSNSKLWGWGNNLHNQLGLEASSPKFEYVGCAAPTEASLNNVVKIAIAEDFSLAIIEGGTVFSSGANYLGQLGLGNKQKYSVPQEVHAIKNATQIAAGNGFALAATKDGILYSWGGNDFGQLGHGNKTASSTPQVISGINNVDKIAVGDSFSAALTKNGEVYIWGYLENENLTPQLIPDLKDMVSISAGPYFLVALNKNGKVIVWGKNHLEQLCAREVPNIENIVKIRVNNSPHNHYCLALSNKRKVYSWSYAKTQLPAPQEIEGLEKIVEISQGENFSVALDLNNTIYSWGKNKQGQLGIGKRSPECATLQKVSLFENPVKIKFFNKVTERLAQERFAETFLKSEQKATLNEKLNSFSSEVGNQFDNEIKELKDTINDEKSSAAQVEDKIERFQKLYSLSNNVPKKSFYSCLFSMKEKLSTQKAKIIEETEAEVFSLMTKRN